MQPIEEEEKLEIGGECLCGGEAPFLDEMVVNLEEKDTADTHHFLNAAQKLGQCWVVSDVHSTAQMVVGLPLAKEKERRVLLLDGVSIAVDCSPLHASKKDEKNGCH